MPQLTVGTTGVQIFLMNAGRKSLIFDNASSSQTIYLDNMHKEAITTSTAGIRLKPGDCVMLHLAFDGKQQVQDEWSAIADVAGGTLIFKETFD